MVLSGPTDLLVCAVVILRPQYEVGRHQPPAGSSELELVPAAMAFNEPEEIWLQAEGQGRLVLHPGVTRVGRDVRCELVFDDPLISRQHARFTVLRGQVTLEDLGSTNGVEVNGDRVSGRQVLSAGDRVVLGRYEATLFVAAPPRDEDGIPKGVLFEGADTLVDSRSGAAERIVATRKIPTGLAALSELAEKALRLKQSAAAERILRRPLELQLERNLAGKRSDPVEVEAAAYFASRLAALTKKPRWIDFALRLLAAAQQLPSSRVVDEVCHAVGKVAGTDIVLLRRYLQVLQSKPAAELTPAVRFLIRRLEGLAAHL